MTRIPRIAGFPALAAVLIACGVAAEPLAAQTRPDTSDNFRWLEDVNGPRAMAWVRKENQKTLNVLQKDPRFQRFYDQALTVAQASDRIPVAGFIGGQLYNFWQDSAHVRGIWRRTSLASYRTPNPQWTTVIDLDALARAENANWVWHGADCAEPAERRCLVFLSDGGEDAQVAREFDLGTRSFVMNGFSLPRAKMNTAWMGEDTLLIATEWTRGDLTKSGYAYIVKRLARGQPLSAAVEIFRGAQTDQLGVSPSTITDGSGHSLTTLSRGVTFFEFDNFVVRGNGVAPLAIPRKSRITDMVNGQAIVQLSEAWTEGGTTIPTGSVAAFDAAAALRDPSHLRPVAVFLPGPRESVSGVTSTHDRLLVGINHNVNGQVLLLTPGPNHTFARRTLDLPANVSSDVAAGDPHGDAAFIAVNGFLTPSSVWLADAKTATVTKIKSIAPKFDASRDVVEQLEATSTDGTKIPYFVVHTKTMKLDGNNPTVLNAYGGFEISSTPNYNAMLGKLWLEQGGVFVLANIRGGGEFGPAWHEAGLKTKRQIIYDDFASVAKDLIARHITSPRRLGIMGGSNGGLLMGVEFTQHPELYSAVDVQVPLLDMMRFEVIQAGASWVGEYGSVSNPPERAFLASISPYQNIRPGVKYPEPFIWTTTKDDRVGPQHARKFAAKLDSLHIPYLFYEVTEGGHGAGANLKERANTTALEFTYFTRQLIGNERVTP
jgi:prolyl oligopeptidase